MSGPPSVHAGGASAYQLDGDAITEAVAELLLPA